MVAASKAKVFSQGYLILFISVSIASVQIHHMLMTHMLHVSVFWPLSIWTITIGCTTCLLNWPVFTVGTVCIVSLVYRDVMLLYTFLLNIKH